MTGRPVAPPPGRDDPALVDGPVPPRSTTPHPADHALGRIGARVASSPVFFAVLFGLGSVLGVYANVHPDEIVGAITARRGYFGGAFAPHAAVFYGALTALVLFTGFVQWAADAARRHDEERRAAAERALVDAAVMVDEQVRTADLRRTAAEERLLRATGHLEDADRRRADAERRLIDGTRRLRRLVRTLPPTTALTTFDHIELQAQDVLEEVRERLYAGLHVDGADLLDAREVAAAARVVLAGVAKLVAEFDARGYDAVYFATLARFVARRTLDAMQEAERVRLGARMLTWPGAGPFDGVRGVLVVDRELSAASREGGSSPGDDQPTELVFAVPEVELERVAGLPEPRWRVLPGPPLAFCQRSAVLYHDQAALLRWIRRRGAYPAGTIERWEAYLRSEAGASIQGLLSVPIIRYDDPGARDERIPAVLNVHCTRAGFLRGRRVRRQLLPLLYPLVGVLHRLDSVFALLRDADREADAVVAEMTLRDLPEGGLDAAAQTAPARDAAARCDSV